MANITMWGAMFGGGGDDDGDANPIALFRTHPTTDKRVRRLRAGT
ncbi:MAG: hypothetical protein SGJ13_05775 [Actinomycetota bacterium]|nr:hypothetical protein [Actinomycetota bacterium]